MSRYEVFKLQDENDTYMVASGIPLDMAKQLGDTHASEIATMALDIMNSASTFVIPHKPKERLRLRINVEVVDLAITVWITTYHAASLNRFIICFNYKV